MNREEWLSTMTDKLRPLFVGTGSVPAEKIRVSCGWPSVGGASSKNKRIGECWSSAASADGTVEIFISPALSDGVAVAAVLAHELVHACGINGHKGPFKRVATAIGLEGPMRATVPGEALKARLNALVAEIGAYPHAMLSGQGPRKKEGTRLLKIVCPSPGCGYVARVTQKWLDFGFPTCPCGQEMALAE
jgi:hypothetical protein